MYLLLYFTSDDVSLTMNFIHLGQVIAWANHPTLRMLFDSSLIGFCISFGARGAVIMVIIHNGTVLAL